MTVLNGYMTNDIIKAISWLTPMREVHPDVRVFRIVPGTQQLYRLGSMRIPI